MLSGFGMGFGSEELSKNNLRRVFVENKEEILTLEGPLNEEGGALGFETFTEPSCELNTMDACAEVRVPLRPVVRSNGPRTSPAGHRAGW